MTGLLQRALAALEEEDSALRARLTGRLGAVLAHAGHTADAPVTAQQALQMARRVADRSTLADVLASTLWAIRGPDSLRESLALAGELGRVSHEVGDDALRALAYVLSLDLLLELGDIDAVQRELEALQRLVHTRREPYFAWCLAVLRTGYAFLEGRLEDCESLAGGALSRRFEGHDEPAVRIFGAQMFLVRREQGRLDEVVQPVGKLAEHYPQDAAMRCGLALSHAQLGQTARARQELEELRATTSATSRETDRGFRACRRCPVSPPSSATPLARSCSTTCCCPTRIGA
jgi:hypothetical protein